MSISIELTIKVKKISTDEAKRIRGYYEEEVTGWFGDGDEFMFDIQTTTRHTDEDPIADEYVKQIWDILERYADMTVIVRWIEQTPIDECERTEEDYKRLMGEDK